MGGRFLAAAIQLNAGSDKDANVGAATALVRQAARLGAELVVLPEMFAWRGRRADEDAAAETIPGPTSDRLAGLARERGIVLVGGSLLERAGGPGRHHNTCPVYGRDGALLARYRKVHLFDVDIPGHVTHRESDTKVPGDAVVMVATDVGRLGLAICYDLRFPELFRRLGAAGAEIVCLPSAFTFPTGAHHWEILVRARAIENQVYVVAPNQIGPTPAGVQDFGHSLIVDPWGTPIARAANTHTAIVAEIDRDYLARVRRELPCLEHRTFDV
ncbi:MAG: carbon-nitrogen hydrolase family protein [Candidatus Binatia bacterium]